MKRSLDEELREYVNRKLNYIISYKKYKTNFDIVKEGIKIAIDDIYKARISFPPWRNTFLTRLLYVFKKHLDSFIIIYILTFPISYLLLDLYNLRLRKEIIIMSNVTNKILADILVYYREAYYSCMEYMKELRRKLRESGYVV